MNTLLSALYRALAEAELSDNDKRAALGEELGELFPAFYAWVVDIFSASGLVVFNLEPRPGIVGLDPDGDSDGGLYQMHFTLDAAGGITFTDDPEEVQRRVTYVPEPPDADDMGEALRAALATLTEAGRTMSARNQTQMHDALKGMTALHGTTCDMGDGCPLMATSEAKDPNVGGGVDRAKIPAADFAGKHRSFPIVTPKDVADAAASIGRAGSGNYSTDELKSRIIAIAKRKGASFTAKLPKAWQPSEAATERELAGDIVLLSEAGVRADGTAPIKLIAPGWGSSGYYSPPMLERDGPKVFKAGTKMFLDHQTAREEAERPEGSLTNLAGEFTTDARWEAKGADGPGLYADAKLFSGYRETINELAPHIGVSIRAFGRSKQGEAEGRKGPLIEQLVSAKSVDFVVAAGAGGKVLEVFEAARGRGPVIAGEDPMSEQELTEARAQIATLVTQQTAREAADVARDAELARLREGAVLREARDIVTAALKSVTLPDVTKARLLESLSAKPPVKDGIIDRAAYATAITEAAKAEADYLASVTGGGQVRGMGSTPGTADQAATEARLKESWRQTYLRQGMSVEDADRLAAISVA